MVNRNKKKSVFWPYSVPYLTISIGWHTSSLMVKCKKLPWNVESCQHTNLYRLRKSMSDYSYGEFNVRGWFDMKETLQINILREYLTDQMKSYLLYIFLYILTMATSLGYKEDVRELSNKDFWKFNRFD